MGRFGAPEGVFIGQRILWVFVKVFRFWMHSWASGWLDEIDSGYIFIRSSIGTGKDLPFLLL